MSFCAGVLSSSANPTREPGASTSVPLPRTMLSWPRLTRSHSTGRLGSSLAICPVSNLIRPSSSLGLEGRPVTVAIGGRPDLPMLFATASRNTVGRSAISLCLSKTSKKDRKKDRRPLGGAGRTCQSGAFPCLRRLVVRQCGRVDGRWRSHWCPVGSSSSSSRLTAPG